MGIFLRGLGLGPEFRLWGPRRLAWELNPEVLAPIVRDCGGLLLGGGFFLWPLGVQVGLFVCFCLFSLQLSVCLWWHDYRRDGFPTLKFGVVMADLLAIC